MDKPEGTPAPDTKKFVSAFNLFTPSIEVLKRNLTSFILFLIVPMVLTTLGTLLGSDSTSSDPFAPFTGIGGMFFALGGLITIIAAPALIYVELKGARTETVEPDDAFSFGLRKILRALGLFIVMGFIFVVSFLLLIVPFFFMLRRYVLAPYYLIDQNLGIFAALKASATDSKPYSKGIWGLIGVQVLIGIVGSVPLLGIIAGPVVSTLYAAAPAIRYEQIKAAKAGKDPVSPIEKDIAA